MKLDTNVIILASGLIMVMLVGGYVTFYQQPQELDEKERAVQLAEMKQAEMEELLANYTTSQEEANAAVTKWNARYKHVPDHLNSYDVIAYINDFSRSGFETFDISSNGVEQLAEFSAHSVTVNGRGYFTSLYEFIWKMENSRPFYRISDLNLDHIDIITVDEETGRDRMQVMVSFNMDVQAYFGGPEGISAPQDSDIFHQVDDELLDEATRQDGSPPVPASVMADERPSINPFFPVVMDQIPPNTHGLPEFENAALISIADEKAILRDNEGIHHLQVGDDVYLGQIVRIDPIDGMVVARLNKGGIIDEARLFLDSEEEGYRRVIGTERQRSLDQDS